MNEKPEYDKVAIFGATLTVIGLMIALIGGSIAWLIGADSPAFWYCLTGGAILSIAGFGILKDNNPLYLLIPLFRLIGSALAKSKNFRPGKFLKSLGILIVLAAVIFAAFNIYQDSTWSQEAASTSSPSTTEAQVFITNNFTEIIKFKVDEAKANGCQSGQTVEFILDEDTIFSVPCYP